MSNWKEPANINIVLTAWYLKHANTGTNGQHTAGDQCTWMPTKECKFTLDYSTSLTGSWTPAQIFEGLGNPINPQAPLTGAVVPVTDPLFIRVKASPTLTYTRLTSRNIPHIQKEIDPATGQKKVIWEHKNEKKEGTYWGGTAYFQYNKGGNWGAVQPTPTPAAGDQNLSAADLLAIDAQERACVNFGAPSSLRSDSPVHTVTTLIPFLLSILRLATRRCTVSGQTGVTTWQEQTATLPFVDSTPILGGTVKWLSPDPVVQLNSRDEVVEAKDFDGPRLLAVHWPKENDPTALFPLRAPETEFLIFFHSSYAQNAATNYTHFPFPFGFDYVSHGLQSYLQPGDFIANAYPLAIPYSMRQAGKKTVLILPMNRKVGTSPELPELNFGDQCQCLLEEIHCLMLRAKPVVPRAGENLFGLLFFDPNIGRIGCGSFSLGVNELLEFNSGASKHAYLKTKVQEHYLFEPPFHDNGASVGQYALNLKNSWAGSNPDRRIRLYNNETSSHHNSFLGHTPHGVPYVESSSDQRFTAGVIGDQQMQNARNRLFGTTMGVEAWPPGSLQKAWGSYHANFVRTFLVDAMRRSGFR